MAAVFASSLPQPAATCLPGKLHLSTPEDLLRASQTEALAPACWFLVALFTPLFKP